MRGVWVLATMAVLAAACTPAEPAGTPRAPDATLATVTTPPPPPTYPGREWRTRTAGDFASLDRLTDATASTCTAVVQRGVVVHTAQGGLDAQRRVYSITKSVVGLLVGIAQADGDLDLDDKASRFVEAWRGGPSDDVTIRQLLANTSGRQWTYDLDYGRMIRSAPDKTAFAVGLGQQHRPGTHWEYNNSAIQVLELVLRRATGDDLAAFAQERLFGPLGMRSTSWARDAAGHPTTYAGITSSCGDVARLGLLVARDGRWQDRQVVPSAFVREATTRSSSDLNAAYGLLWWTNREGRVQEIRRAAGFAADRPVYEGRLAPGAPDDTTWALGYGNQMLLVVPSRDLVAVRLGPRPADPEQLTMGDVARTVLDGVPTEPAR